MWVIFTELLYSQSCEFSFGYRSCMESRKDSSLASVVKSVYVSFTIASKSNCAACLSSRTCSFDHLPFEVSGGYHTGGQKKNPLSLGCNCHQWKTRMSLIGPCLKEGSNAPFWQNLLRGQSRCPSMRAHPGRFYEHSLLGSHVFVWLMLFIWRTASFLSPSWPMAWLFFTQVNTYCM